MICFACPPPLSLMSRGGAGKIYTFLRKSLLATEVRMKKLRFLSNTENINKYQIISNQYPIKGLDYKKDVKNSWFQTTPPLPPPPHLANRGWGGRGGVVWNQLFFLIFLDYSSLLLDIDWISFDMFWYFWYLKPFLTFP